MTISGSAAYERLLGGNPMKEKEFFAALEHAGKFTWRRSKRKQSHYVRHFGLE